MTARESPGRRLLMRPARPHGAHSNSPEKRGRVAAPKKRNTRQAFVVALDGSILPAAAYDPAKWHILVEGVPA
jgi:hypothetical protein